MATYKIHDGNTPGVYMKTWDNVTGEVLTVTPDYADGFFFNNMASRDAAITKINACVTNTFIGHVPPPPGH